MPTITSVTPLRAVEGGRITIHGTDFPVETIANVTLGEVPARVAFASSTRLVLIVAGEVEGGRAQVKVPGLPLETAYVSIGARWATGLHQVDSPVFDRRGNLFVTYSGSRGQEAPVSIFRVTEDGTRESFVSGIVNATSFAFGPDGQLYVSSRFEGSVYRIKDDGGQEQVASDLGVACGLAFDDEGGMYVGDRSGTIFRVRDGRASRFATLPPSVAAFHLAMSADHELFVTGPTLNAYDPVYRIGPGGEVRTLPCPLGRPQGLTFDPDGTLHVVDALAGASGVYRFGDLERPPELVISGSALVGLAFGPRGEIVVTSNDTAYRFD
ncbi:MAG: IPT/TIG domain-containing protein [Acidobacteria bacterium]|nr:IPT/TIG domain-containing protein [Acidobacteriota bacterium]